MKLYRKLIIWTLAIAILAGVFAFVTYFCLNINKENASFISNILIGIFASSLLLFVNSLIGYKVEKKNALMELAEKLDSDCVEITNEIVQSMKPFSFDGEEVNPKTVNKVILGKMIECQKVFGFIDIRLEDLKRKLYRVFFFKKSANKNIREIEKQVCDLSLFNFQVKTRISNKIRSIERRCVDAEFQEMNARMKNDQIDAKIYEEIMTSTYELECDMFAILTKMIDRFDEWGYNEYLKKIYNNKKEECCPKDQYDAKQLDFIFKEARSKLQNINNKTGDK